jgi:hypothetical protein
LIESPPESNALPVPAIEIKFLNHFGNLEGQFATGVIAKLLSGEIRTNGNPLNDFEKLCDESNEVVENVIGVLWEFPLAFRRIFTWRDRLTSLEYSIWTNLR